MLAQLAELQTEYLDVYLLHRFHFGNPMGVAHAWQALEELSPGGFGPGACRAPWGSAVVCQGGKDAGSRRYRREWRRRHFLNLRRACT